MSGQGGVPHYKEHFKLDGSPKYRAGFMAREYVLRIDPMYSIRCTTRREWILLHEGHAFAWRDSFTEARELMLQVTANIR